MHGVKVAVNRHRVVIIINLTPTLINLTLILLTPINHTKGIFDLTNLDSDSVNVLEMRACKHVHDKLPCTRLQNNTIGASPLCIRIRIPKSNIP